MKSFLIQLKNKIMIILHLPKNPSITLRTLVIFELKKDFSHQRAEEIFREFFGSNFDIFTDFPNNNDFFSFQS
jgi:hypothetical protein